MHSRTKWPKSRKAIFAILDELAATSFLAKAKLQAAEIQEQMHCSGVKRSRNKLGIGLLCSEKVREANTISTNNFS